MVVLKRFPRFLKALLENKNRANFGKLEGIFIKDGLGKALGITKYSLFEKVKAHLSFL